MTDAKITSVCLDLLKQGCEKLVDVYKTATGATDEQVQGIDETIHNTILKCLEENGLNVYTEPVEHDMPLYGRYYLSQITRTCGTHRAKFIIHRPDLFYLAEFSTKEQLDNFLNMLGLTCTQVSVKDYDGQIGNTYREYIFDKEIYDRYLFCKKEELPENAKPFKALSNGHITTCYFTNNGHTVEIYRPNANYHDVYDPMPDDEMNEFIKQHGLY